MKRTWGSQWDTQMMSYLMERGPASFFKNTLPKVFNRSCLVLGAGPETAAVSNYSKAIVGINISAEELRKMKNLGVSLILGDAQRLPLKQSLFDMVICRSTLHHLSNPNGALAEMNRVLRSGSYIFLQEPGLLNMIGFFGRRFFPTEIHDPNEKPFNPISLRKALSKNFKVIKEVDFFLYSHIFPIMGKRLKIFGNHYLLKAMFDLDSMLSKTFLGNFCWIFIFLLKKE